MSIYLVTFGKLRYLGLMNIDDAPAARDSGSVSVASADRPQDKAEITDTYDPACGYTANTLNGTSVGISDGDSTSVENTQSRPDNTAMNTSDDAEFGASAGNTISAEERADDADGDSAGTPQIDMDESASLMSEPQEYTRKNFEVTEEQLKGWVLLRTVRGLEMGLVGGKLSPEQEERYRSTRFDEGGSDSPRGPEPMLQEVQFIDIASPEDIENYYRCRSDEENVLVRSREILLNQDIDMKLVDVEYMLDYKKLFFYFTSEQRVDFRAYVRDLAREFRARIEMRQIGVRDEARLVKGIAPCGRQCCCSYWLHQFTPICIRMVKEQKLALNPTKISGICGRLMCCMAFEQETYSELWSKLPAPGTKIKTEQGIYIMDSVDLATEHANIRFPSGRLVPVSINEFEDFKEAVLNGREWGEEPSSSRKDKAHHGSAARDAQRQQRGGAQGRSGQPQGRQEQTRRTQYQTERAPAREKISLDEHLARRDSENESDMARQHQQRGAGNPQRGAEPRQGDRRRPQSDGRRAVPRRPEGDFPDKPEGGRPRRSGSPREFTNGSAREFPGGQYRDSGPQGRQRRR